MAFTNEEIWHTLQARFGNSIVQDTASLDMLALIVEPTQVKALLHFLHEDEKMRFSFFTDLCGAHFPDNEIEKQFAVIYHLHNWLDGVRIRVKTFLHGEKPEVASVCDLFPAANWQERETYDFYGIIFTGHPDLRRILNMDEMTSFPLRKEFPLEDPYRTDKDDRYFGREPQAHNVALR